MSAFETALALHETMALRLLGRLDAKEQTPTADAFVQAAKQVAEVQKAVFSKSLSAADAPVLALGKDEAVFAEAAAWQQAPMGFDTESDAVGGQSALPADGWPQVHLKSIAALQPQPLSAEELSRAFERDARRYDEI